MVVRPPYPGYDVHVDIIWHIIMRGWQCMHEWYMCSCVNIMFNLAARLWAAPLQSQCCTLNFHVAQLAQK